MKSDRTRLDERSLFDEDPDTAPTDALSQASTGKAFAQLQAPSSLDVHRRGDAVNPSTRGELGVFVEGGAPCQTGEVTPPRLSTSSWNEVPQALFLSWSPAMQRAYCSRRDADSSLHAYDPTWAEFFEARALRYREAA